MRSILAFTYILSLYTLTVVTLPGNANAQEGKEVRRKALFGELHVHSSNSFDVGRRSTNFTPELAYKYAQGEAIPFGGTTVRINQPLDFMAVTDHAMYLGVLPAIWDESHPVSGLAAAEDLRKPDTEVSFKMGWQILFPKAETQPRIPVKLRNNTIKETWATYSELARKYYKPGQFTTLVGYEWTSSGLHRNILFRGTDVPKVPFSSMDSQNPEDLWEWMDEVREKGVELLAIPHNPNQSNGLMFSQNKWDGSPIDSDWAKIRMRNEPLVEVTQVKGTSETAPILSPTDEWAGFEIMDERMGTDGKRSVPSGSYVRQAYKDGLVFERKRGFNPYKFGMIGSTDGHNAVTSAEENNYSGKMFVVDGTPEKRLNGGSGIARHNWMLSASGLAGVWADENTREEVFDALRRKEAFATSGPRIKIRIFAGWNFPNDMMENANWVNYGYTEGVHMGQTLSAMPNGTKSPKFAIWAMKDPASAGLQRLQIVKGWVDKDGNSHEQVLDVACSDAAVLDASTQRCADNGAQVDLATCDISRNKGDVVITALWSDPDFDVKQQAFYYARVLENPTCRWSTWEANRLGVPLISDVSPVLQERAWSSPIWYAP